MKRIPLSWKVEYEVQHRYGRSWVTWARYSRVNPALAVRDHFRGIKRIKSYPAIGPCSPYNAVRVIETTETVSIIT